MKSGFSTEKSFGSLYASYAGMIQIRYKGHRQHLYLSPFRRTPLLFFLILCTFPFRVNPGDAVAVRRWFANGNRTVKFLPYIVVSE